MQDEQYLAVTNSKRKCITMTQMHRKGIFSSNNFKEEMLYNHDSLHSINEEKNTNMSFTPVIEEYIPVILSTNSFSSHAHIILWIILTNSSPQ